MFENIISFFKKMGRKDALEEKSKDTAKERLQLVLTQDRANVSADFLDMMRQEIIDIIKKYIDVDENQIDVKLTNRTNEDGTIGAPALYANIPIVSIKNENKSAIEKEANKKEESKKEEKQSNESESKELKKDAKGTEKKIKNNNDKEELKKDSEKENNIEVKKIENKEENQSESNEEDTSEKEKTEKKAKTVKKVTTKKGTKKVASKKKTNA